MFRTPYLAVQNVSYPGNEPAKCFIPRQQFTRPGMEDKKLTAPKGKFLTKKECQNHADFKSVQSD